MESRFPFDTPSVRLVPEKPWANAVVPTIRRPAVYRPLILGPVLLVQSARGGPWVVEVKDDRRLLPAIQTGWDAVGTQVARRRALGLNCRAAAALMVPEDAGEAVRHRPPTGCRGSLFRRRTSPLEMYGWSLLIQPRGIHGAAHVDPHDEFPDLPAFFKLPRELLDRVEFLASRGIASRPLALVTSAADFDRRPDGTFRNRFTPAADLDAAWVPSPRPDPPS
ncbi:MAG: hypothetical protein EBR86_03665 [Planctomycetia bacterium]|nr:hypothetical protein [Planctomycetia bacterium]